MLFEIESYLTTRMVDNWTGCPIVYGNQAPVDMSEQPVWARFVVSFGAARMESLGLDKVTTQSMRIILQIFVREGDGTGPALVEEARFRDLFQYHRKTDEDFDLEVRVPEVQIYGSKDSWYQVNSSIQAIATYTVATA